jgi:hypothetical protein
MKNTKLLNLFLIPFLYLNTTISAQNNNNQIVEGQRITHHKEQCRTYHKRALNFQNHPGLVQKRKDAEEKSNEWIRENEHRLMNRTTTAVMNIPTVVHVVYKNATQNISDAQIQSQMQVLNEDFSKTNSDFTTVVPTVFLSLGADVEFNFCLAQFDPNGDATTGITRTATNTGNIGDDNTSNVFHTANGGIDSWDDTKYLNIYVCEIDSTGFLLGYATQPASATAGEDGVVIDYKFFGTTGTATAPLDKGRTATHEVGHFFNLDHIWGFGCFTDDNVSDTPDQESDYGGCPVHPQTSCGSNDMFMNFMDYVNDACMAFFTTGQKTRMHAALNGSRIGIKNNSSACGTSPVSYIKNSLELTIFPNPADKNTVRISINVNSNSIASLKIYDLRGQILQEGRVDQFADIDVSSLKAGVYFAEVILDNKRGVQKIIIQ